MGAWIILTFVSISFPLRASDGNQLASLNREKLTHTSLPQRFEEETAKDEFFTLRLSASDRSTQELKLKVDITRAKFLKVGDQLQLSAWPVEGQKKCEGTVTLTTVSYLFAKVKDWAGCVAQAGLRKGMLLYAQSAQLKETIAKARLMTQLLLKKRALLLGQTYQQEKVAGVESLKAKMINDKYEEMIETLKKQWEDELAGLGPKRIEEQKLLEDLKNDVAQIDLDLERYRVEEQQLHDDQWAL